MLGYTQKHKIYNVLMPLMILMALLLFPVIKVMYAEDDTEKYKSEISLISSSSGNEYIARWGLKRAEGGASPEFYFKDAQLLNDNNGLFIGDTDKKTIYLTFDEGYENGYTEIILDVLKKKEVKAAFFITGDYFTSNTDIVRRMVEEGHDVGNHTMNHPSMPSQSSDVIEEEILSLDRMFYDRFGKHMTLFRPPMGEYSERVLKIAGRLGYRCMLWSFAYKDWLVNEQKGTEHAYKIITENLHGGAILLLHAVSKDNANALAAVIDNAVNTGYIFGKPSELP